MPSFIERAWLEAAGPLTTYDVSPIAGPITELADQVEHLTTASETVSAAFQQAAAPYSPFLPPRIPAEPVPARSSASSSTASQASGNSAGEAAKSQGRSFLDFATIGVSPLIREIIGLFGPGDSPAPPQLLKFALPPSLQLEAALSGGRFTDVDTDQAGRPRSFDAQRFPAPTGSPTYNFTLKIDAFDARSVLDRAPELAAAVRDAMLNSHQITDTLQEIG